MVMRVGWSVRQNKHRPLPPPTVDPVVAIELANGNVVPAPHADDCTGCLENLVGDSAALYFDVPGVLPTVTPLRDHPVHRVVRPGDEAIQRHRHVPDHRPHCPSCPQTVSDLTLPSPSELLGAVVRWR